MKNKLKVRRRFLLNFYFNLFSLVESKFSVLYRTQMNELKDEIAELTEKLRQANNEQKSLEEER
jgi:flagellar biosynthesis/type III secretory pathway chaperone